jgi:hypothetical protein
MAGKKEMMIAVLAAAAGIFAPAGGAGVARAEAPAAGGEIPAATADTTADDLNSVLEMSEAEKRQQDKRKADLAFALERLYAGTEIKGDLLYMKKDVDAALAILNDSPANTQKDNIDRICRAFAKADPRFARPYELFGRRKYKEAAVAAKKILDPQRATYLSAATYIVYAESLALGGDDEGAVEAYADLLGALPYHMSFAATASVRTAQLYEKSNRFFYAMHMYNNALKDYWLIISAAEQEEFTRKVDEYAKIYEEPMRAVVERMEETKKLLDAVDSGRKTQKKEQEVIAILDDLIKTMEEQNRKPSPRPGAAQGSQKNPADSSAPKPAPGGQPQVVNARPVSPATVSQLPGGKAAPPPPMEKVFDRSERGDWANLPPLERIKISRAMEKVIAERYRDAIRDYHRRLAEHGAK